MAHDTFEITIINAAIKRFIDILIALIGLILFGWLIALAAIASRVEFGSSGFFTQDRVGRNRTIFRVIKIRTMKYSADGEMNVTFDKDPRVANLGSFLRKTKIDELPQLINVLAGQMSLVGPRPTVESDYDQMTERQMMRANVLPGITGWAQINGNTSLRWPERIELDLDYIEQQGFWFDMKIIFQTIFMIASGSVESHPSDKGEWN